MLKNITDKNITEEGERMVPSFHKGAIVFGEHIARYESVNHIVKDKAVLDIACGSGYGTYMLSEGAKTVLGVDIDSEAVKYAKRNYSRKNNSFMQGSGEKIPVDDASYDVIVSFETIEHIKNYKKFIEEAKRVIKPEGVLVVSTPNDMEFPEGNHFHLHEFTENELRELLKKHFKYVEFTYQYTWLYTAIFDDKDASSEGLVAKIETINSAPVKTDKAIYFTAICSNAPISKEVKKVGVISEHWSARRLQEQQQQVKNETDRLSERVKILEQEKQIAEGQLKSIYSSRSWALVTKVRRAKSKLQRSQNS